MNAKEWIALADDYKCIAQDCNAAGDRDRAALWRNNAAACQQAAALAMRDEAEKSRRLYDILAGYDAELSDLEANMTRYTVAEYNERWQGIMQLREQAKREIEALK